MVPIARRDRWSRGGAGGTLGSPHSIHKPQGRNAKSKATQVVPNPCKPVSSSAAAAAASAPPPIPSGKMQSRISPLESSVTSASSSTTTNKKGLATTLSLVQVAVRQRRRSSFLLNLESGDESACLLSSPTLDDSTTSMSSGTTSSSSHSCIAGTACPSPPHEVNEIEECPSDEDVGSRSTSAASAPAQPKSDSENAGMAEADVSGGPAINIPVEGVETNSPLQGDAREEQAPEKVGADVMDRRRGEAAPAAAVRWGTVEIHSHAVTLGDNVCSSGPPVTIGWTAFASTSLDVDAYENGKPPARHKGEMLLPAWVREDMLREAGYPRSVVLEAREAVAETKHHRLQSSRDGRLRASIVSLLTGGRRKSSSSCRRRGSNSYATPPPGTSKGISSVEDY